MDRPQTLRILLLAGVATVALFGLHATCAAAAPRITLPPSIQTLAQRGPRTTAERVLLNFAGSVTDIPGYGHHVKCNLAAVYSVLRYRKELTPDELAFVIPFASRPALQRAILSPSGHFRIHFDTSGTNAPDMTDQDRNGVPDYIDGVTAAADSSWHTEIEVLGYQAPPPDAGLGGGDECDLYVIDMGDQYYGYTYPDTSNRVAPGGATDRFSAWFAIDRSFESIVYSTHGLDAARVTIAHEFFHVVQLGDYGIWDSMPFASDADGCDIAGGFPNRWFFEMSSVWMETIAYPGIHDYLHSDVPDLFIGGKNKANKSIAGLEDVQFGITPCVDLGYGLVLFWRFVVHKFSDDRSIVKFAWENSRTMPPLQSIDVALRLKRYSLADTWCDFTEGLLFTGRRTIDTLNYFEGWEADSLPSMHMRQRWSAVPQFISDSSRVMSAVYYASAISSQRDSLYTVITNHDTARGFARASGRQAFRIDIHADRSFQFQPDLTNWCALLTTASTDQTGTTPPFPDPFLVDGSAQIFFPARVSSRPKTLELRIFTESGTFVFGSSSLPPQSRFGKLGLAWDGRRGDGELVHSGVYLYAIGSGDDALVGKIAVVRR